MSSFQIIVGSMLGGTEYVAEACEETLLALKHQTTLHLQPSFEQINSNDQTWLICTSTHGAGDFPDNIQNFVEDLKNTTVDLSPVNFMIIGIGDSNYDTFCKAATNLKNIMLSKGCKEKIRIKTLDMREEIDPEDLAQQWLITNKDLL
ncbi:MAG: flavodoxin domain-containing protein [Colwellia sp.]|nr:flavodoxin domain-containing protein [Colwellia sp.]